VQWLADKVKAAYDHEQPAVGSPLLDFDERDLLPLADEAGFDEIHLDYEAAVAPREPADQGRSWEALLRSSGNPLEPTLAEAIDAALSSSEARELEEHLRPLVEGGERSWRWAGAYLWAK
jgi:arsenite methyltransferase